MYLRLTSPQEGLIIKSPRLIVTESSGNYFQIKLSRPSAVERTGNMYDNGIQAGKILLGSK